MNWFYLALICALFTACSDALSKRLMRDRDEWITGTLILGISGLLLLPVLLYSEREPVSAELILVWATALPLEILSYYLFLVALRSAPLSLTMPLLAFTPVFTVLTSAVILGEGISIYGAAGIMLVTAGAFVLNLDPAHERLLAPVTAIIYNRGARMMLFAAMIWSVTATLGKKGLILFGPMPYGIVTLLLTMVIFAIVGFFRVWRGYASWKLERKVTGLFVVGGILMAAATITHFISLSMAPVAYMIAVKRLSMVFAVILGWLFFDEEHIRVRLLGSSMMVAGVFFLQG